jgi:hypothetical protein
MKRIGCYVLVVCLALSISGCYTIVKFPLLRTDECPTPHLDDRYCPPPECYWGFYYDYYWRYDRWGYYYDYPWWYDRHWWDYERERGDPGSWGKFDRRRQLSPEGYEGELRQPDGTEDNRRMKDNSSEVKEKKTEEKATRRRQR